MIPQWPWSVYSQKHMSEMTSRSGRGVLDRADRARHDPAGAVIVAAGRVLVLRDAEEDDGGDAEAGDLARLRREQVDGKLGLPRHGLDRHALAFAVPYEERQDEVARRKRRLAHHRAQCRGKPQAARPRGRKRSGVSHGSITYLHPGRAPRRRAVAPSSAACSSAAVPSTSTCSRPSMALTRPWSRTAVVLDHGVGRDRD